MTGDPWDLTRTSWNTAFHRSAAVVALDFRGEEEVTVSGTLAYDYASSTAQGRTDGLNNGWLDATTTSAFHLTIGSDTLAVAAAHITSDHTESMREDPEGILDDVWTRTETGNTAVKLPLFLDLRYGAIAYYGGNGDNYAITDSYGVIQSAYTDWALLHYRGLAANYACSAELVSPWTQVVDRQRAPSTYYYPLAVYAQPYDDLGNSVVYTEIETLKTDPVAGDADKSVTHPIAFTSDFVLDEVWQAHAAAFHPPNEDNGEEPFSDSAAVSTLRPHGRL